MDNVMPRMTGVEAAIAIRSSEKAQQDERNGTNGKSTNTSSCDDYERPATIFGITGNALAEDVEEFIEAGCNEVLTKPLNFLKLKQLISQYGLLNNPA